MMQNDDKRPYNQDDDKSSFEQRLAAAQARRMANSGPEQKGSTPYQAANGAGLALRLATEMVAAVLVGIGLGYMLDKIFTTSPVFLLIMLCFGLAAGILGAIRAYRNFNMMLTKNAYSRPDEPATGEQTDGTKRE